MIEIVPKSNLRGSDIKRLRELSDKSISDIKKAGLTQSAIKTFKIFESDWETTKLLLAEIAREYSNNPNLPYLIRENKENYLSPQNLKDLITGWRSIELETQKNIDLENGYGSNSEEYIPIEDDWA